MMSSRLTAVLERTLDAKAAQAVDTDSVAAGAAFDPARRPPTVDRRRYGSHAPGVPLTSADAGSGDVDDHNLTPPSADRQRSAGRRRWLLVPAAAACLAVVLGGGAVVLRDDGADDVAVRPLELGDPPAGWLVPAWVPEGMALWGVDASSYEQPDASDPATIPQLFGDPAGDRAVYVTSHRYEINPATAEDVTVRGATGSAGTGWGAAEEDLGDAVQWQERGVGITALYRGVSRAEAIAVVDALEWRSDDPLDGFAPPADDAWPLRAEVTGRDTVARDATLLYSNGVPTTDPQYGQSGLMILTSSSSTISAGYLETWYLEGTGDGTAPLVTYREDWHELSAYWPDGRSVIVSSAGAAESSLTPEVMEHIATSATVATTSDLTDLRDATGARIEALPVVATADTTVGSVDIHADRGVVRLCLRRPGVPGAECETSTGGGNQRPDGSALATAQWTIDGSWKVVIASRGELPRIFDGSDPSVPPTQTELAAETTSVGDWTVQLVQPAPGVDSICLGSEEALSCTARRSD